MKHHKLRLEKGITIDTKRQPARRSLQPTKARRRVLKSVAVDGGKGYDGTRDQGLVVANEGGEVGQAGRARVRVPARARHVVDGAVHGAVVGRGDLVGHEEQRRARVGNGHVRRRDGGPVVDAVARGLELPEPLRGVDGYKGYVARVWRRAYTCQWPLFRVKKQIESMPTFSWIDEPKIVVSS
jgi:hypothetical protein